MRMQNLVMVLVVAFVLCAGSSRGAARPGGTDSASETEAARLFAEGRRLTEQGNHEAACPKYEASLELDRALGTLLNLANCYEQIGRLASAWRRYRELAILAAQAGQIRRERYARERVAALEPRLPRLVLRVPAAARAPGLVVTCDGVAVDSELLGIPMHVDPGDHVVTATVPGYEPFSTTVTAVEAREAVVEIPVIAPFAGGSAGQPDSARAGNTMEALDPGRTRRILGLTAGGTGLAMLASGLGIGWSAISTWNDAFERGLCERGSLTCTREGQAMTDRARSRATLSNTFVGLGVGLMATGAVLYFTAPDSGGTSKSAAGTARLVPMAGPDALGLAIAGGF